MSSAGVTINFTQSPGSARRRWGQVFTPKPAADWMVRWACSNSPARILDPSIGGGVFIDAVRDYMDFVKSSDGVWKRRRSDGRAHRVGRPRLDGIDIDPVMVEALRGRRWDGLGVSCWQGDFLSMEMRRDYDAIIANPPYIRHHEHKYEPSVFARFDRLIRRRLSRMTNAYGLFLIQIWNSLSEDGRAAVITPAEWLNADFGKGLKAYFMEENAIDGVVHFSHASKVFQQAMTTAAITLFRRGRSPGDRVMLATVNGMEDLREGLLNAALQVERSMLDPTRKWTPLFARSETQRGGSRENGGGLPDSGWTLGDVARCVRGIATGANEYFALRESDRREWGIDRRDLAPCVTKAQQVTGSRFTADNFRRLMEADHRVLLLKPRRTLDAAMKRYLSSGEATGVSKRYLPSHRPEWFRPEERAVAPIWVSVFSRGRFRFVLNECGALNLTAFHAIYPKSDAAELIAALFAFLSSPAAQRAMADHHRIYAEGLLKVEPRDVASLPIPRSLARRFNLPSRISAP